MALWFASVFGLPQHLSFSNTQRHLHPVRDPAAILLFAGSDTLNCVHCHGKQHRNCMEKGSSPLLQKWCCQEKRSTILKSAKALRSAFKAGGALVPQHTMRFVRDLLEHDGQPGASPGQRHGVSCLSRLLHRELQALSQERCGGCLQVSVMTQAWFLSAWGQPWHPTSVTSLRHLGSCPTCPLGAAGPRCTPTRSSAVQEKGWGDWPRPKRGCHLLGWKRSELWMPGSCQYSSVSQAAQSGISYTCIFCVCSVGPLVHPPCSPHQLPSTPSLRAYPSLLEPICLAHIHEFCCKTWVP